jgi:autotransporter-associated beta strand protein
MNKYSFITSFRYVALAILASVLGGNAQANDNWNGASTGSFSGAGWSNGAPNGQQITFAGFLGSNQTTYTLNNDLTGATFGSAASGQGGIYLNGPSSVTLNGNAFTLVSGTNNTLQIAATATLTINNNITLTDANDKFTATGGTGDAIVINGNLSGASTTLSTSASTVNENLTFNTGTVTLAGLVLGGTQGSGNNYAGSSKTTFNNSTLNVSGGITLGEETLIIASGTTANVTGSITSNQDWASFVMNGGSLTAASVSLLDTGGDHAGGQVILNGGTLTTGSISAIDWEYSGASQASLMVLNGTQIDSSATSSTFISVTPGSIPVGSAGNVAYIGTGGLLLNTEGFNDTITAKLADLSSTLVGYDNLLSSGMAGPGFLTKSGTGTLTLSGADTYSGGTTVSGGVLLMGNASALGAATAPLTVGTSATSATLDLNGNNLTVGSLSGAGTGGVITSSAAGTGTVTLTDNNTTANTKTYAGVIQNGATNVVALNLPSTNLGTLTLSGVSTYSGGTTISGGAINLTGAVAGPVTVNTGAALTGFGTTSTTGIVGGLATVKGGATVNLAGANSADSLTVNGLTLGNAAAFGIGNSAVLNFTYGSGFEDINVGTFGNSNGTLTLNTGGAYINVLSGPAATGTYTLLNFGSQTGSGSFSLNSTTVTNSITVGSEVYTLIDNSNSLQLGVTNAVFPIPGVAYWKGGNGSVWSTVNSGPSTNWSTDLPGATDAHNVPGSNTDVIFAANSQTGAINTTLGGATTINSLNFNSNPASTTISADGSTLTINALADSNHSTETPTPLYTGNTAGNGVNIASGAGAVTINVPINLGNSQTWTNASANTFTVGGNVAGTAATSATQTLTLTDGTTGAITISGNITNGSAGGNLAVSSNTGSGPITLSGTNTYSGGTLINSGTLKAGSSSALGTGAVVDGTFFTAATLDLNGNNLNVGAFSGNTLGSVTSNAAGTGTYTLTINNTGGGTKTFAGLIQNGTTNQVGLALGATNAGTFVLTDANTYSGGTSIGAGTLQVGNATALGSGAVSVTSGAALDLNGTTMTSTGGLTLNGTGVSNGGALTNSSSTAATYAGLAALGSSGVSIGGTGSITLSNAGTITGSGDNLTLNGAGGTVSSIIGTGAGTLTVGGTGPWVLAGANTFSGKTTVNNGSTLQLANLNALQNSALTLNGGGGTTTLQLRGATGGTFAMGTQTNNGVNNNIFLSNGSAANTTFTVDIGSTNATPLAFTLGTIAYTSFYNGTDFNGTLNVTNSTSDGSSLVIGAIKSDLEGNGLGVDSNVFAINSAIANLSIGSFSGDNSFGTRLAIGGTGNTTFTGAIADGNRATSVTKTGTGTLTIQGASTYTNPTAVNGGVLNVTGSLGTTAVTVASGAVLTGAGTSTTTGVLGGAVTVNGGGAINLAAANSSNFLTIKGLTLGNTGAYGATNYATLNYTLGASGIEGITVGTFGAPAGTLSLNSGGAYVDIFGTPITGTYTLASFASQTGAGAFSLSPTTAGVTSIVVGGDTYTLVDGSSSLVLQIAPVPVAPIYYWNGGAGTTVWNDTTTNAPNTNWASNLAGTTNAGTIPGSTADVILNASNQTGVVTTTLGANTTINSLNVNGNGTNTIAADGSTLTIGGVVDSGGGGTVSSAGAGINIASGANAFTINVPIVLGGSTGGLGVSQTWTNASANTFTIGGTVSGSAANGTQTLTFADNGTGSTVVNGIIGNGTGGGKLAVAINGSGAGPVVLNGVDTYSGGTTVTSGTVQAGNNAAFGAGTITLGGGTVDYNGSTLANAMTISSNSTLENTNTGTAATQSGNVAVNSGFTVAGAGSLTFGQVAANGFATMTLNDTGTVTLGGNSDNSFLIVQANSGTLILNKSSNGSAAAELVIAGATVQFGPLVSASNRQEVFGGVTLNSGTLDLNGQGGTGATIGTNVPIPLTAFTGTGGTVTNTAVGTTGTLTLAASTGGTFAGTIQNGAGLVAIVDAGANETFSGNNSYSGGTTISGGTLKMGSATALGAATGSLAVNGGTLDLNANNLSVGTFSGSGAGAVITSSSGTGTYTLTVDNLAGGTGTLTYAGAIQNGTANVLGLTLASTNTGILDLTHANTYSGGTIINGGVLQVGNATALGNSSGAVLVGSGAALDLNGTTLTSTNSLTLNGTGVAGGGALTNSSLTGSTYAGLVTLGSSSVAIGGTGSITLSNTGTITGSGDNLTLQGQGGTVASVIGTGLGSLTVQSTGAWILSGANTYGGSTTISQGTLIAANNSALGSSTGPITLGDGNTGGSSPALLTGGAFTIANNITVTSYAATAEIGGSTDSNSAFTGTITTDSGNLTFVQGTTTTGTLTLGSIVGGPIGGQLSFQGPGTINVTGVIADPGMISVDVTGGNTIFSSPNTYSGATLVDGGTLTLAVDNAIPSASDVTVGFGAPGTLAMGTYNDTVDSLTLGTVSVAGTITGTGTLTATGFDYSVSNGSVTADLAGDVNLDKGTTATVVLAGNNTYTGDTTISSGTLQLGNGGTTGALLNTDVINDNNGNLTINRSNAFNQNTDLNGSQIMGGGSFTQAGSGTTTLTMANNYHGGTAVNMGALILSNTSGSATGDGPLAVNPGGAIGGTGTSSGSSFTIGAATGLRATVLAGMTSVTDQSVGTSLTLLASSGGTIQNANLTFNINSAVPGSSSQLNVGDTLVTFGSGTQSTTLTLNLVGSNVISAFTPYILIAGNEIGASQYAGLDLGTGTTNGSITITPILNSGVGGSGNVTLAFGTPGGAAYYAPSYLFLYQDSATGVDDVEVEVVPEPSTWAMILGGLGVLVLWQRRRRDQSKL